MASSSTASSWVTSIDQLDLSASYTYADYLRWRLQERVELIWGKIFRMAPAPARMHQRVLVKLSGQMLKTERNDRACQLYAAPFDVRFPKEPAQVQHPEDLHTVVQPDLCVVCDPSKLDERGCLGAPDWIVEIVSPSTAKKDLNDKFQLYESQGVREYWIVHPQDQSLNAFLLEHGRFQFRGIFGPGQQVPVGIFPGYHVDLNEVFEDEN
jgi:Uma2 family endonuclease